MVLEDEEAILEELLHVEVEIQDVQGAYLSLSPYFIIFVNSLLSPFFCILILFFSLYLLCLFSAVNLDIHFLHHNKLEKKNKFQVRFKSNPTSHTPKMGD